MSKSKHILTTIALAAASLTLLASCGSNSSSSSGSNSSSSTSSKELAIVHFDQTILGDKAKELGVSVGIKKGNSELQSAINDALTKLNQSTRSQWMIEATDRANENYSTSTSTYYTPTTGNAKTLTIGLECDYAPFNWTETAANNYTYQIKGTTQYADGYDIQVAKYLAYTMGYNLEVVKLDWESLIPSLQTGTINAVIAGMTDTEERRQSIDFTDEYYRSELVLVVKASSSFASATSLTAFKGAKLVSQVSTVTDEVIDDWVSAYGVTHLNAMDTFATCAIAVQNGTADAMTAELPVANSIVNSSKN